LASELHPISHWEAYTADLTAKLVPQSPWASSRFKNRHMPTSKAFTDIKAQTPQQMHNRLKAVQNPQQIKQVRQLSGLAYIPTCRSPIVDHHETQNRPSPTMRRNVFHSTHGPRRSGKFVAPR